MATKWRQNGDKMATNLGQNDVKMTKKWRKNGVKMAKNDDKIVTK